MSDLVHSTSANNSFTYNNTGDLVLTNSANDKDIHLVTDDGSGGNFVNGWWIV